MRLVVAGDGPLLGEARASAEALRIEKQVTFLGSRRDIPELMCAFDVLLAPSLHEGFPLVALEAQATGLALIVSDAFRGLARLARHRLVYAALGDRMRAEIHALSMQTLTPEEHRARA